MHRQFLSIGDEDEQLECRPSLLLCFEIYYLLSCFIKSVQTMNQNMLCCYWWLPVICRDQTYAAHQNCQISISFDIFDVYQNKRINKLQKRGLGFKKKDFTMLHR